MSVKVSELLDIYSTRLAMQEKGTTNPSQHVKEFTKRMVDRLSQLDGSEIIKSKCKRQLTTMIRASTGEILAELDDNKT